MTSASPSRLLFAGLASFCLAPAALAGYTNNIMIVGFWPPTNGMLREWSQSPTQNPAGWQGQNWEGRGWNIHSYFPEFPSGQLGRGEGDFEVDYQDVSNDFWRIVGELKPAAIITFSRANTTNGWELEGGNRTYAASQWTADYLAPTRPTPELPIMSEPAGTERFSSLPMQAIVSAVAASGAAVTPFIEPIDNGRFVSNFAGYHANWYQDLNESPDAAFRCFSAGHIHVGMNTDPAAALLATRVTLRTLTDHLNAIVPSPGVVGVFATAGIFAARRRR